ncbi:MAG: aldo/keto reductase [Oligoflexales bacterium]
MEKFDKIIFGCGNFGGIGSIPELRSHGENEAQAHCLLDEARRRGIFQFDTANTYGGGASEVMLGRWLAKQEADFRNKVRISTKVGNPAGLTVGDRPLSRKEISFHVERSLRRLGRECIDVYYLHEPDRQTPMDETLEALRISMERGDVGCIGLSNVDAAYVQAFLAAADDKIREKVRYVQNEFNLLQQRDREHLFPLLERNSISYVAYSPLAGGLLSGKYRLNEPAPVGSRLNLRPTPYLNYLTLSTFETVDGLLRSAEQQNSTASAMALQHVLRTSGVCAAVIGPRRKEHFEVLNFEL